MRASMQFTCVCFGEELSSQLYYVKTHKPLVDLYSRSSLLGSYLVVTLAKRKSWKAMMDSGRDPREAFFHL